MVSGEAREASGARGYSYAARGDEPADAGELSDTDGRENARTTLNPHANMGTPFRLIVVAASGGGLEAFERIVSRFAPDFHGAIAAVLDTGDCAPQHLVDNLKRHTALQVSIAQEGDALSHGRIVLAPAGNDLVVRASRRLGLDAKAASASALADRLFASAARQFGRQVIGVVLTGAGADGSAGLVEVKKHGGRSVVQSPSDAKVPGMPINAIVHDSPDHIVLLDDIAPLLIDLIAA